MSFHLLQFATLRPVLLVPLPSWCFLCSSAFLCSPFVFTRGQWRLPGCIALPGRGSVACHGVDLVGASSSLFVVVVDRGGRLVEFTILRSLFAFRSSSLDRK